MRRLEKNEILDAIAKALRDAREYFAGVHGVPLEDVGVSLDGADRIRVELSIPVTFDVEDPPAEVPPTPATAGVRVATHSTPLEDDRKP